MTWEEIMARSQKLNVAPGLVLREELQKAILFYLSGRTFFSEGVFQGGTALRLLHDNIRFSEDLDFVFVRQNSRAFNEFAATMHGLPKTLHDIFTFVSDIVIREQKSDNVLKRLILKVSAAEYQVNQKIHIEAVNVPSYDNRLTILSYPPFNPPIRSESLKEILSDKIIALALRPYLKGRDIWDLHFVLEQKRIVLDKNMTRQKALDYGKSHEDLINGLEKAVQQLRSNGGDKLRAEMARFLPPNVFGLYEKEFDPIATGLADQIQTMGAELA